MKIIAQTERLYLREATEDDASFFFALMTSPDWIRNIGDRGLKEVEDARQYLIDKIIPEYQLPNTGYFVACLKSTDEPIGNAGVLKREFMTDPDLGYSFLPTHFGKGYATEAAGAMLSYARTEWGLTTLCAFTTVENEPSQRVLKKLGFHQKGEPFEHDGARCVLFENIG